GTGLVNKDLNDLPPGGDVSAEGTQGLSQGPHVDQAVLKKGRNALRPNLFHQTPARGAEDSRGVGLVHHESRVVAVGETGQFRKGRRVSVHAENGIRNDKTISPRI